MRVYDRFRFGDLVSFSMLDGRQYRSREACYAPPHGGGQAVTAAQCPELLEASRTMLGAEQEAWLYDGLARSRARWNIIGQNVLMAPLHSAPDDGTEKQWTDAWDGYPACRQRLMDHIAASGVANPVVLSGDNHAFWANDLKRDFRDPSAPAIATEFVGTSVSSNGPPYDLFKQWLPYNPHVRFFDSRQRGYVSIELAPDLMTARFQAISDAADPNASLSTLRTFAVEAGRKGAMAA
jgi:alkaline phosphatase D